MGELAAAVEQLRKKRNNLAAELRQIDQAIKALSKLGFAVQRISRMEGPKRKMSAAARRRIAAAQRARWAKVHAAKRKAA
jgi:uncharacterized coiled-coil DUF342 family protein